MSLRLKLLLLFTLAVAAAAGVTAWNAQRYAQRQFQQADQQRSDALVAQFRRELTEREAEVTTSVQTIADAESTLRMVLDLSRPQADPSIYAGDARGLAAGHQLDFLEIAAPDGTLISSAQWPDRVGYKNDWVARQTDWNQRGAFLDRVELPDRVDLGVMAVRMVRAGNLNVYLIGGERLNSSFLENLSLPAGMRALLYRNLEAGFVPGALFDAEGPVAGAESFEPLIESLQKQPRGSDETVPWSPEAGSAERFVTLPLTGRHGEFLGALLLGSAQGQRLALENYIAGSALAVAAAGLVLAFFLSWWIAARVAHPLARLSEGIGEVAAGDWDAQVEAGAVREVGQAIGAFNKMTKQLADERAGQVARERAAAWRQLAGQLAAELKSLLPPLQKAVESVAQSPESVQDEFADGVAPERTASPASSAVRQTLATIAACAGKLGEFASLPVPRLEAVNLNEAVRAAVQSFEPRFSAIGRPPITPELFLDDRVGPVRADAVLVRKALENLLLFVIEDMPAGGTFTIHTRRQDGMAHMILSGSGTGMSRRRPESRTRTQDPAARVSGIGLSLATVQSIISSHGGNISIESAPLAGTTFYLDWPVVSSSRGAAAQPMVPDLPAVLQNQPEPELPDQRESELPEQPEKVQPLASPAQSHALAQIPEEPKQQDPKEEVPKEEVPRQEDPKSEADGELFDAPKAIAERGALEEQEEKGREESIEPEPQLALEPELQSVARSDSQSEVQPVVQPVAEAGLETQIQMPLDSDSQLPAAAEAALELQPGMSETAEVETRDLAVVIEEVIETRPRRAKIRKFFANDTETDEEPAAESDTKAPVVESADAGTETVVSLAAPAAGNPNAENPAAEGPVAEPEVSPVSQNDMPDSLPELFGFALPGAVADSAPHLEPITAQDALTEAKLEAEKMEEDAEANRAKDLPEPAAEPAPVIATKAPTEHEDREPVSRLGYSPLTYRG